MKKIYCFFLGIMLTAGFFCYRYSKITETSETTDPANPISSVFISPMCLQIAKFST